MVQLVMMLQVILVSLQIIDLCMRLIHKRSIAHVLRKTGHRLWMRVTHLTRIRR